MNNDSVYLSLCSINEEKGDNNNNSKSINNNPDVEKLTINEIINKIGYSKFHLFLFIGCGFPFMLEGFILVQITFTMKPISNYFQLNKFEMSTLASSVFFGYPIWGFLSDVIGRRRSLMIVLLLGIFSSVLASISPNVWILVPLLFLCGLSCGSNGVPMTLLCEYLPTYKRGIVLLLLNSFWIVGSIYEAVLGIFVLNDKDDSYWRIYMILSVIPLLPLLFVIPFLPESIRYLTVKGRKDEIKTILHNIEKFNCVKRLPDNYEVIIPKFKKRKFKFKKLLNKKVIFPFINIVLFWGLASFCYYSFMELLPDFFIIKNIYIGSIVSSLGEIPGILITTFLSMKFGRKIVLSITMYVYGIFMIILLIPYKISYLRYIVVFIIRGAAMGSTCLIWVVAEETFTTSTRSTAIGIANFISRIGIVISPYLMKIFNNLYVPMSILVIASLIGSFLGYIHPVETKDKDLKDFIE